MIDAVITWVDGADPAHAAKRAQFRAGPAQAGPSAPARFASSGEIRFAVRSVLKFCPFVRRVHVVTDGQRPNGLDDVLEDAARVRIVDHAEIFADHADLLPVFSSRSIETMIHRIPDLADRFLYLNDDIFVGRPQRPEDYFDGDAPILRGTLRPLPGPVASWIGARLGRGRPGYGAAQRAAARLAGRRESYLLVEHQPHPMRRATLAAFYAGDPSRLRAQAGHRFRSAAQVSPVGLTHHLEMAAGARVTPPIDVGYVRPGRPTGRALIETMDRLQRDAFASLCVQSLELMGPDDRAVILSALEARYG